MRSLQRLCQAASEDLIFLNLDKTGHKQVTNIIDRSKAFLVYF